MAENERVYKSMTTNETIDFWREINRFWQIILNKGKEHPADKPLALDSYGTADDSFFKKHQNLNAIKIPFLVNDQESGCVYFIFSEQFVNQQVIAKQMQENCAAMLAVTYQTAEDMNPVEGIVATITIAALKGHFALVRRKNKGMFFNAVLIKGYLTAKVTTLVDEALLDYLLVRDRAMAEREKMQGFFIHNTLEIHMHKFDAYLEKQRLKDTSVFATQRSGKFEHYIRLKNQMENNDGFHAPSLLNSIEECLAIDDDDIFGETMILSLKIHLITSLWNHTASYDKEILFRTVEYFFEKVTEIYNPDAILIALQCIFAVIESWGGEVRFQKMLECYPVIKEQGVGEQQREIVSLYNKLMKY